MTHKTPALSPSPGRTLCTIAAALASAWLPVGVGCTNSVEELADLSAAAPQSDDKSIVGGTTTTIQQNPWQVSIQTSGGFHFCGGSIISDSWVLTANHCVDGTAASSIKVVAGTTALSTASSGQTRTVAQIVRFPGYTDPSVGKDAALLRLSSPLTLNGNVQAISLATADDAAAGATAAGVQATVSGWGTLSSGGSSPDTLRAVTVPIISNSAAQAAYTQETITADQLAAGASGKDSCQGDSGGPLTVSSSRGRLLAGIVSWGYGCGDATFPGMYGRVSSFAQWISDTTGIALGGGGGGGGGGGTPPPPPPPPTSTTLFDSGTFSGARGSFTHFAVTVPSGVGTLDVVLSGTSGDADLYVRRAARPTTRRYDCRPYTDSSNESCSFAAPAADIWYVSVQGYSAYAGARVVVTAR